MADAHKPTAQTPEQTPPQPKWVPPKADPRLIGEINRGYKPPKLERRDSH